MVKLKAIVVGGDFVRNRSAFSKLEKFIDIHHIDQNKVPKASQIGDAQVIVVVTRFSSIEAKNAAKALKGKKNSLGQQIEIVSALTPNHILEELKKHRHYATFLKEQPPKSAPVAAPEQVEVAEVVEAAPAQVAVPEVPAMPVTLGLGPEELWTQYGPQMADFVRQAMKPGEKLRESSLVEMIASVIGIPQQDVRTMLPQLALRGILMNTVADTWKAPARDAGDEPDLEPAPVSEEPVPEKAQEEPQEKPKKKREHMFGLVRIIAGLSMGPYETMRAIAKVARRCPDFRGLDGKEISPAYGDIICQKARALGVIEKDGKQWKINVDSTMKITLVDEKPQKRKVAPAPRDSFEERFARVVDEEKAGVDDKTTGPRVLSASDAVRGSYDGGILTFGTWRAAMEIFRDLLPDKYWDEMAAMTVSRRLKSGTPEAQLQYKHEFKSEEWNALAWEALKKLPAETFSMLLRRPDREMMTCPDCKESIPIPKRCSACHKKRFVNRIQI